MLLALLVSVNIVAKPKIRIIATGGTIAAGDPVIGEKIAEAMEAVGKDGAISVEDGQTFGIDIDQLRAAVLRRQADVVSGEVDLTSLDVN